MPRSTLPTRLLPTKGDTSITITQKHVDKAICGSTAHCAIATAIRDTFHNVEWVSVRPNSITIRAFNHRKQAAFVHRFMAPQNKALQIMGENDTGTLTLPKSTSIKLIQAGNPVPSQTSPRQARVNENRRQRVKAGKKDKTYDRAFVAITHGTTKLKACCRAQ